MTSPDQAVHRAGALNTPTTTNKGTKANLLEPFQRVKALIRILRRLAIQVIGMQEVGNVTRAVFRLHPGWLYLPAAPNTVTRINRKGSALAVRKKAFDVLHRKAIKVPYRKAFRRSLKQPRVLTADKNTAQRTLWIVMHPPRRTEPEAQRRVMAHVAAACQKAISVGIVPVVLSDTNNVGLAKAILGAVGMKLAQVADVTAVFVGPGAKVLDKGVETEGIPRVITDHLGGLPWADIELGVEANTTATRIPV